MLRVVDVALLLRLKSATVPKLKKGVHVNPRAVRLRPCCIFNNMLVV